MAKVVIGGGKEAVCTVPVFKEIFRIFSRDFLFVARRFVDGIFFSRWSYREMQPYQTRMQGILEPVKMGPPMMQSRTQNA